MPQPILHLNLADRVLHLLARRSVFTSPVERNALLLGSLGPDLGLFPGGESTLSSLVHHSRSTQMCRALLANAQSPEQRAYAWGWVTHTLADALIHPKINAWCAEQHACGSTEPHLHLHVRVEVGADVACVRSLDFARVFPLHSSFDRHSIRFLGEAYAQTYDAEFAAAVLLSANRNAARLTRRLYTLELLLANEQLEREIARMPHQLVFAALKQAATFASGTTSIAAAFLNPIVPPEDLMSELRIGMRNFEGWFLECYDSELRELQELDMDAGNPMKTAARAVA